MTTKRNASTFIRSDSTPVVQPVSAKEPCIRWVCTLAPPGKYGRTIVLSESATRIGDATYSQTTFGSLFIIGQESPPPMEHFAAYPVRHLGCFFCCQSLLCDESALIISKSVANTRPIDIGIFDRRRRKTPTRAGTISEPLASCIGNRARHGTARRRAAPSGP